MRIAVLALQGAFAEHRQMLSRLHVESFEVRQLSDWLQPKDGLIIPGGESTVQSKLLVTLGLMEPIRRAILEGLPVFGTCAGMILLAKEIDTTVSFETLSTMDVRVVRNAYGRQLGSFHAYASLQGIGDHLPLSFIRAPYVQRTLSPRCEVLGEVDGRVIAVRQGNQLATSFHPELDDDLRTHQYFLQMIRQSCEQKRLPQG